jgi:RTX calcium-binding nonapeptide repeat (4 copies)
VSMVHHSQRSTPMHRPTPAGPRRRTRRALLAAALPAILAATALPAAADAATVELVNSGGNGVVAYAGEPGEANNIVVRSTAAGIMFDDQVPIRTLDSECRIDAAGDAICPGNAENILVFGRDRNDRIMYTAPHGGAVFGGDGADIIFGGLRQAAFGRQIQPVSYDGKDRNNDFAVDTVSYTFADRGVQVDLSDQGASSVANDGRPGDREHIDADVEVVEGSNFDDPQLFGSDRNEVFRGLNGNDVIGTGGGSDIIDEGSAPNGSDILNGGNGTGDTVSYGTRTSGGVRVTLDTTRNDGAPGEQDDVRPNVENVSGTNFPDVLIGNTLDNVLNGFGGDDIIDGFAGDDEIVGGAGVNRLFGNVGEDFLAARNGQRDTLDCGANTDRFDVDSIEESISGCETRAVGVGTLHLTPKALQAEAGEPAQLRLSWRVPRSGRKLRTIELRLTRDEMPVGDVTIRPHGERITAGGAVKLMRKHSRLTRNRKTVTARLAVRLDESLAGQVLKAEVEATDTRGRRQLERDAGTVRVAR